MDILHKISVLMKEQGKKQKDLTDFLGISKNVFTEWKSGRANSYMKYLPQIAEFLNVSVDYLCGNAADSTVKAEKTMKERDDEIVLEMFNGLNARHRFEILKLMEKYAEQEEAEAKETQSKYIG